jgi:hypothetical protein
MAWFNTVVDKVFKGSRVTHVANASDETILAKVTADVKYKDEDFEVSVGGNKISAGKNQYDKCQKDGFVEIAPNKCFKFEPDTSNSSQVYVTIVKKESGEVICDSAAKSVNDSVIVDRSGNVQDTLMGTIWTDRDGNCYN